ncbi:MAG TPA: metal/formaldehyde-sensitive transcriptional repressor, partial [Terriglobales bacterium]|nr:metal/formaldehyde-sensitive transcriptional repressor [Terriglobales bacterium]
INFYIIPPYSIIRLENSTYTKYMAHTIREKEKLRLRVRRIQGQVEAVARALNEEQDCSAVLQLISAARGAMNGLMAELLEDHIRYHVLDPTHKARPEQAIAADELVDIVRSYLK